MAGVGKLGDLAARSGGEALAFGLGFALARALEPAGVELAQEAWKVAPIRAPDAGTMAAGVAQGQMDEDKAAEWAREHGYSGEAFQALVDVANTGPAIGLAFQALRRGTITDGEFETALRRSGLETRWDAMMLELQAERLDLGQIATAIHRGIMAGEGTIIREPPAGAGKIPHVEQSKLSGIEEAASHGIDPERLRVLVGNTGLPLALGEMLRLLNMGRVDEDDVRRAVAQSNLRNEYMDAALVLRRQLPTARDYLENALRGYRTLDEAVAGAALHGMTEEDATMIYQNQGRPMTVRQITQALARGGKFKPEPGELTDPYEAAIVEGSIKPAYYDLTRALRYTLPSAFVIRGMAAAGDLDQAQTEQLLLETGWKPDLAKLVAGKWAAAKHAASKLETKAELETEYAAGYISEAEFRAALEQLGYLGGAQDHLVHLNDARRLSKYREKVVDAIGKAYQAKAIDAATATSELADVHVTGQAAAELVHLWDLIKRANDA